MSAQILQETPWSSVDVENFNIFLGTQTGQRFLARVVARAPAADANFLGVGQSIHKLGKLAGATHVISEILYLRTSESSDATRRSVEEAAESVSQHYPSLDTDEGWSKELSLSTPAQ